MHGETKSILHGEIPTLNKTRPTRKIIKKMDSLSLRPPARWVARGEGRGTSGMEVRGAAVVDLRDTLSITSRLLNYLYQDHVVTVTWPSPHAVSSLAASYTYTSWAKRYSTWNCFQSLFIEMWPPLVTLCLCCCGGHWSSNEGGRIEIGTQRKWQVRCKDIGS